MRRTELHRPEPFTVDINDAVEVRGRPCTPS
jgi:hypothetical protein